MSSKKLMVLVLTAVLVAPALAWSVYRLMPESSPLARGAEYAATRGCIECHGKPLQKLPEFGDEACESPNRIPLHPKYQVDCADALAYFEASRLLRQFDERNPVESGNLLAEGERLARKYYCFQCHGQLGQGGFGNKGSLKGYVPGYFGADFRVLTNNGDPESVRNWIAYGRDPAILKGMLTGRIARYFFNREAINMPSYQSLDPGELETLVNYEIAINKFGPMTTSTIRAYAEQSQATARSLISDSEPRELVAIPRDGLVSSSSRLRSTGKAPP